MKPTVFFHGNTWQKPGDFVQICGAGFDGVKSISISQLNNREGFGFILDSLYNRLPTEYELTASAAPSCGENTVNPEIFQKSDVAFKFQIPKEFDEGIYCLSLDGTYIYVNAPRIEELLGNEGGTTTPGGKLRIIGANLAPKGLSRAVMLDGNSIIPLEVSRVLDNYSIEVTIPENTKFGNYKVSVSNTFGDDTCWSMPFDFKVGANPRDLWPKEIFDVKNYGAKGDDPFNAVDFAFEAALEDIRKNGGGVLYISSGMYFLKNTYVIPPKTELRGDGVAKSVIFWRDLDWELDCLPPFLFKSDSEIEFHDFTIGGSRMPRMFEIGSKAAPGKDIYFHDMRVFINSIAGEKPAGSVEYEKRCRMEIRGGGHGISQSVFVINGDNVQIYNNEMRSSGAPFQFGHKSHVRISNNYFRTNVRFWMPVGHCLGAVIEDNEIDGITLGMSGEGIYYARNKIHSIIDNNREAFTTDMGRGDYNDTIKTLTPTTFELNNEPIWQDGERDGFGFFVITGTGMGQYRRIISSVGKTITIDEPFSVPIDSESIVAFSEVRDRFFFVENSVYDAGHFQLFGTQVNTVLDGNTSKQIGGFRGWARNIYYSLMPNWYISYINMTMSDGHYMHMLGFGDGHSGKSEICALGGDCKDISFGTLIRGNKLYETCYILLLCEKDGAITDAIVQDNYINGAYTAFTISGNAKSILVSGNEYVDCNVNENICPTADVIKI